MPELKLKDLRIPELHLPEMTRDDIAKALGEARKELGEVRKELNEVRKDIDLSRLDMAKLQLPQIDVSKADVQKAVGDVAKTAGAAAQTAAVKAGVKREPRGRTPFLLGGLIAIGLAIYAVMTSPSLRPRVQEAIQKARAKVDEYRADSTYEEPRAFDAAVAVPVEPSAYADDLTASGSPYDGPTQLPEGMGSDGSIGAPDGTEVTAERW